MSELEQQFKAQFDKQHGKAQPDWLSAERERAMTQFIENGFPTRRDEEWKYTSLYQLSQTPFQFAGSNAHYLSEDEIKAMQLCEDSVHLVFIDGHYSEKLSTLASEAGVHISTMAEALQSDHAAVQAALSAQESKDSLSALNLALFQDGAFIHIDDNVEFDKTIQITHLTQADSLAHNQRHLIVLGENAKARVIERYSSLCKDAYFNNIQTQLILKSGAALSYYKCLEEAEKGSHISDVQVRQESNSQLRAFSFALGGGLVRSDLHNLLDASDVSCELYGLYLAKGKEHVDHHTKLWHAKPNCNSRELYKGIITDKARAVFNGKIEVAVDAQKTDANLHNHNLLLSKTAEVDTKPQLEIYADDVKCAHGATVGQLDDNEIFYLRARGIDETEARQLLLHAFANDVATHIEHESLREAIQQRIEVALANIN